MRVDAMDTAMDDGDAADAPAARVPNRGIASRLGSRLGLSHRLGGGTGLGTGPTPPAADASADLRSRLSRRPAAAPARVPARVPAPEVVVAPTPAPRRLMSSVQVGGVALIPAAAAASDVRHALATRRAEADVLRARLAGTRAPAAVAAKPPAAAVAASVPGANLTGGVSGVLARLELTKYLPLFVSEEIDTAALKAMTEEDMREMGLPLGPRLKLLAALSGAA